MAVSESSFVRVFAGGELRVEIAAELFLSTSSSFAIERPVVHELPEVGLTVALARGPIS